MDKQNYFPYPKALIYRAGPWVLFALLQTLVLHRLGLSWQVSVNDAAVSTLLMVVVGFSTDLVYRYYQPGKEDQTYRVVFGLVMAILFCVSLHYLPGLALPDSPEYVQFLNASMPVRFVFAVLVIFFITLLLWIRSQLTEQKEMDRRKLESEQLMKEAEAAGKLLRHMVFVLNNDAHRFYERLGFVVIEDVGGYKHMEYRPRAAGQLAESRRQENEVL